MYIYIYIYIYVSVRAVLARDSDTRCGCSLTPSDVRKSPKRESKPIGSATLAIDRLRPEQFFSTRTALTSGISAPDSIRGSCV